MKTCPNCKEPNEVDAKFCVKCGKELDVSDSRGGTKQGKNRNILKKIKLKYILAVAIILVIVVLGRVIIGYFNSEREIELHIQNLKNTDRSVRLEAIKLSGVMKDSEATVPLISILNGDDSELRMFAAWALGEIKDSQAVDPLIVLLNDNELDVRGEAVKAIGKIGDARAVDPLILILKDGNREVAREAAEALGKIGDPRAIDPLNNILENCDGCYKMEITKALKRIEQGETLIVKDGKSLEWKNMRLRILESSDAKIIDAHNQSQYPGKSLTGIKLEIESLAKDTMVTLNSFKIFAQRADRGKVFPLNFFYIVSANTDLQIAPIPQLFWNYKFFLEGKEEISDNILNVPFYTEDGMLDLTFEGKGVIKLIIVFPSKYRELKDVVLFGKELEL